MKTALVSFSYPPAVISLIAAAAELAARWRGPAAKRDSHKRAACLKQWPKERAPPALAYIDDIGATGYATPVSGRRKVVPFSSAIGNGQRVSIQALSVEGRQKTSGPPLRPGKCGGAPTRSPRTQWRGFYGLPSMRPDVRDRLPNGDLGLSAHEQWQAGLAKKKSAVPISAASPASGPMPNRAAD